MMATRIAILSPILCGPLNPGLLVGIESEPLKPPLAPGQKIGVTGTLTATVLPIPCTLCASGTTRAFWKITASGFSSDYGTLWNGVYDVPQTTGCVWTLPFSDGSKVQVSKPAAGRYEVNYLDAVGTIRARYDILSPTNCSVNQTLNRTVLNMVSAPSSITMTPHN
jgi:hypothetical protein